MKKSYSLSKRSPFPKEKARLKAGFFFGFAALLWTRDRASLLSFCVIVKKFMFIVKKCLTNEKPDVILATEINDKR